ncbi:MAG: hypothetical protein ACREXT_02925 [Gammaproteobacteria bacterium]
MLRLIICFTTLYAVVIGAPLLSAADAVSPSQDYRSLGDMSVDERVAMMTVVGEYNNCVYQEGVARVNQFPDIRQAADAALGACENLANKLRETIDAYGFEPGFSEQFVRHMQSRAARTLLPELAIRKSG